MSCPVTGLNEISAIFIKPTLRPDPSIGTKIVLYDQTCTWTSEHLTPTQLNEWRTLGDPVIDNFFERYGEQLQNNEDTYKFIEQLSLYEQQQHIRDESCQGCCIIHFTKDIRQRPKWFNKEQIQLGQQFFLKYHPIPVMSIFFYTLTLGYGFQQLNDVLIKTQYLSSPDLAETYRRLIETLQMIVHATSGDIDNFDETFLDVVRVRLLHGMVRYKIKKYNRLSHNQVPINQEDSLITLLGFSFSVLQCMEERMGIQISNEDKQSYLHLWRYIGWLIGINDELLDYMSSYKSCRTISESIFYHYYLPSQISKHLAHHSMLACYMYIPMPVSLKFCVGLSQILLGKQISEALAIDQPRMDLLHLCIINLWLQTFRLFSWIIGLNFRVLNEYMIQRNKIVLNKLIQKKLNNQLRNFSLFKKYESDNNIVGRKSLKNCPCGYYQKKHEGIIKTNDIGIFRLTKPISFSFILRIIFFIFCFFMLIRK
jgi:hypothetical protein